jgi:hypothetical protein
MKKNKKAEICFVIHIAGFFFKKKFCYEVIAKQKKKKSALNITTAHAPRMVLSQTERHSHTSIPNLWQVHLRCQTDEAKAD